jgi:predicted nucleotidyltransferase
MDARPILIQVARALHQQSLEAIMIGNAAAALQGAPVTAIDVDFLFRKTPANVKKLKAVANALGAVILRPYYPASGLFRLVRDEDSLQVDFMTSIHGVKSFEQLRARAVTIEVDGFPLRVASLADIIRSKTAAGRPRDQAVLEVQREPVRNRKSAARRKPLAALRKESDRGLTEQIRRLLDKPMDQRTHFLRKRVGICSTSI